MVRRSESPAVRWLLGAGTGVGLAVLALGFLRGCGGECKPATCAEQGVNCGTIPDGCGGRLDCGACATPEVCGGGGPNVCGTGTCVPESCASLGAECGLVSDGCADVLGCGGCQPPARCGGGGTPNVCGCTPNVCGPGECGLRPDACGGSVDCGGCVAPEICGGGGAPNLCGGSLPPDPADVAPDLDPTVATTMAAAVSFLYTGDRPIQQGVDPDAITVERVSVLRGKVTSRGGEPLSAVQIAVRDHPEYGFTYSRADGWFDLAVNGGDRLILEFVRTDYLPVQRVLAPDWQDSTVIDTIVLVPLDPAVTLVDPATGMQVAQSSLVADADGARRSTLLFPAGSVATLVLPDGTEERLTTFNVRATEYTVGAEGPASMPGELPPSSAYTWATELSLDEAQAAGAQEVRFDPPAILLQDNFLGFPVGTAVPTGTYDRATGRWAGGENGRVVKLLGVTAGQADLDVDGSGVAADAASLADLGITDDERTQIAQLYAPGDEVWRVLLDHFSPLDCNWPWRRDGLEPSDPKPERDGDDDDDPCKEEGSIIGAQNQSLAEVIPIVGAPFALHYQSDRQLGYAAGNVARIQLSGLNLSPNLKRIELEIQIAGRRFNLTFQPASELTHRFTWDGQDAYGRTLQGWQTARVSVGYVYDLVYRQPSVGSSSFALYTGDPDVQLTGTSRLRELTLWNRSEVTLGSWDARGQGALGGWTLGVHHAYDPASQVLYLGDGRRVSARSVNREIKTAVGNGTAGGSGDGGAAVAASLNGPAGIAFDGTGNLYIADRDNHRVRKVTPDGIITTVAGDGRPDFGGDGGPATAAQLYLPTDVATDGAGNLYIADTGNHRVRRVAADGRIETVAGTGAPASGGDGGVATLAGLAGPTGLFVDRDGSLYIADRFGHRIRRVGPEGIITTIAGTGQAGFAGDGGAAARALLQAPSDVAVDAEGYVYIADTGNNRLRRIAPDGVITTVAGTGEAGFGGDGGPGTAALLDGPSALAVDGAGNVHFADTGNHRVRRLGSDGNLVTIAGTGDPGFGGDGGPALQAAVSSPAGVALHPLGAVYVADTVNLRVRRVAQPLPGVGVGDLLIPSPDGAELLVFDPEGRHLGTLSALTAAPTYTFEYDASGRLASVTDRNGRSTRIERDAAGAPTSIVAPTGHRTLLALDAQGYLLEVENPAGARMSMTYEVDGLLATFTEAGGGVHTFAYGPLGRLTQDIDPASGVTVLVRTEEAGVHTSRITRPDGSSTSYRVERILGGGVRQTLTDPSGVEVVSVSTPDGAIEVRLPDGSRSVTILGGDPRWGLQAPRASRIERIDPDGSTRQMSFDVAADLDRPGDATSLTRLEETIYLRGEPYVTRYTPATAEVTYTTPQGRLWTAGLDALGRVVETRLGDLEPARRTFDPLGRVSRTERGSGAALRQIVLAYADGSDRPVELENSLGERLAFEYDAADRMTRVILPDGESLAYAYDANGNVVSVTPPGRAPYTIAFTADNLPERFTAPAVGGATATTRFEYAPGGVFTRLVRPDGLSAQITYDPAGRATGVVLARGTHAFNYDPVTGQLAGTQSADGVITSYTEQGDRLTAIALSGVVVARLDLAYDAYARLASEAVNGGAAVLYAYDRDGLPVQAGDLTLRWRATARLLEQTTVGSVTTDYVYDGFGGLAGLTATVTGAPIFAESYLRDAAGRIVERTQTIGGSTAVDTYGYDSRGRLLSVARDGAPVATYEYDANGNRVASTDAAGARTEASFDPRDRILSQGTLVFAFDDAGDLDAVTDTATGETTGYTYDALGSLVDVALPDGRQVRYFVDGSGRRVAKAIDGAVVQAFLYRGELQPAAELDAAGAVVSRFVYGIDDTMPEYMVRGGQTYALVTNGLGSVRLVVDVTTGGVLQRLDYDVFGNVLVDTNPGFQPFGFAGGLYDPDTGLVRFGARDYDPRTGRWTTPDPLGFASTTNLYVYAFGDPVNARDPTGEIAPYLAAVALCTLTDVAINAVEMAISRCFRPREFAKETLKSVVVCAVSPGIGKAINAAVNLAKRVRTVAKIAKKIPGPVRKFVEGAANGAAESLLEQAVDGNLTPNPDKTVEAAVRGGVTTIPGGGTALNVLDILGNL